MSTLMQPQRLDDGGLLVPNAIVDPETGTVYDGTATVYPGDELYALWIRWMEQAPSAPLA